MSPGGTTGMLVQGDMAQPSLPMLTDEDGVSFLFYCRQSDSALPFLSILAAYVNPLLHIDQLISTLFFFRPAPTVSTNSHCLYNIVRPPVA